MSEQLHLVLHPVRADRAADFERFLSEVVTPAVRAQRPELDQRWRVMRSDAQRDGIVTYAFLLDGGSLADDWELGLVLPAHYGEEAAERFIRDWSDTFAPMGQWAEGAVTAGQEANQAVWTLEPVALE